jgi:peptidoglycan-N-acetylglucosamine deacetylase
MLNYRNTNIFFALSIVITLLLLYFFDISWWWSLLWLIPYQLMIAYGSATIRANFFLKSYIKGNTSLPQVAITFDDGPNEKYTPILLDLLEKHQVKATFFCIGKHIDKYPEIVKRMHQKGHIIGNHSYSHSYFFDFFPKNKVIKELQLTNNKIFELINQKPLFFRPPYGVTNPPIAKAVKHLGLYAIGWSIRSFDTKVKDEEKLWQNIAKFTSGDVLLFHDTNSLTIKIVERLILEVKKRQMEIVNLDKILQLNAYA